MRFDFFNVPRITLGAGTASTLPVLAGPLGASLLVVYNGGERPRDRVVELLAASGVRLAHFRQKGEPTVADIDAGLEIARRAGCTGVIAIGGGSAIDAGKAIAGLLTNGGSALDYMEVIGLGQKITQPAAPWIAMPTTAGTGAEVTRNAVIGEPSKRFKASLRSELLLPIAAIIDPELGVDVPPSTTAWSGMDALCQCIEAYLSNGSNPMTDGLALQGIELASGAIRRAVQDGRDLAAREAMSLAALLSGIALTNAGLGAVHGFAAPIGANYPAPHGVVCAALLPHVLRANADALQDDPRCIARFAAIGRIMAREPRLSTKEATTAAIEQVAELTHDLDIPPLGRFGLNAEGVPAMVALAKKASSMKFNPAVLSDEVLANVLRAATEP